MAEGETIVKGFLPQTELIDYNLWEPLQGELKILYDKNYEKLVKSFKENGAFVPAFIWKQSDEGKERYRILDAHQRHRMFLKKKMKFHYEGHDKPTTDYPCIIVEAETEQEAAKKLLVITSQYGTMTQEGLDEFTSLFEIDDEWKEITTNFDGIFTEEPKVVDYSDKNKEIDVDDFEDQMKLNLTYESEIYWKVREELSKIAQTPEGAIIKLLGIEA